MTPDEIRNYRRFLRLTQEQLAAALDVSATTVARWERGESPPESPGMLRLALRGLEMERAFNSKKLKQLEREVATAITRQHDTATAQRKSRTAT